MLHTVQLEGILMRARGCVCRVAQVAMRTPIYITKPTINICYVVRILIFKFFVKHARYYYEQLLRLMIRYTKLRI